MNGSDDMITIYRKSCYVNSCACHFNYHITNTVMFQTLFKTVIWVCLIMSHCQKHSVSISSERILSLGMILYIYIYIYIRWDHINVFIYFIHQRMTSSGSLWWRHISWYKFYCQWLMTDVFYLMISSRVIYELEDHNHIQGDISISCGTHCFYS